MIEVFEELGMSMWVVWVSVAPSLTFGALIAGVLHVTLPPQLIRRALSGRGGVARAVLVGVPLPLCSCGVIPAGLGLHRDGASRGATVGFLISTPQTGVDSALVSASLLGLPFAIYKVIAAAITGLIGGNIAERLEPTRELDVAEKESDLSDVELNDHPVDATNRSRPLEAIRHAEEILRSIWGWLLVGVVASALIDLFLPTSWFNTAAMQSASGGQVGLAYLFALTLSLPLYVCATASVPIAASLVVKGMPIGVALIFLMAGPATNIATIGAIHRALGRRSLIVYLMTLIIGSLLFALSLDLLLGWEAPAQLKAHLHNHHPAWWELIFAVGLGSWMLFMLIQWSRERLSALWKRLSPTSGSDASRELSLEVSGLTCQGCARRLKGALNARIDVDDCSLNEELNQLRVRGALSLQSLAKVVREVGFTPHLQEETLSDRASGSTDHSQDSAVELSEE